MDQSSDLGEMCDANKGRANEH